MSKMNKKNTHTQNFILVLLFSNIYLINLNNFSWILTNNLWFRINVRS